MALEIGPIPALDEEFSDEDLELGWRLFGGEIMETCERRHGSRPWGWWTFETEEGPPPFEPGAKEIRLAELGELTDEELGELEQRASDARALIDSGRPRAYISTGAEGPIDIERDAVDLYERVKEALES